MKMVRSLLLGSAAGFVAVAGAQAADMPVKAKPVEYVKICTLYGAGFYYLPGTDICIKWGAYVRSQWYYNHGAAPTGGPFALLSGQGTLLQTQPNDLVHRSRAIFTMDARTQTEYGTLRGYILYGFTHESPGTAAVPAAVATPYATRAFLQFAGFTLGKASSFYDVYPAAAYSYMAVPSSDTGDSGAMLAAYTFQFGNGFSATISAEDPRRAAVVNTSLTAAAVNPFLVGAVPVVDPVQIRVPDVVANLRVDQAWGTIQIMGAVHDNSGAYFLPSTAGGLCNVTALGGTITGSLACGHPDDELGFAVGIGGQFNIPMPTGLTDRAAFQFNYSEGASRYVAVTQPSGGWPNKFGSTDFAFCPTVGGGVNPFPDACRGSLGLGYWTDGVFGNPGALPFYDGSVQSTKVWGVNAAWDHLWTRNLKTSVYGYWLNVEYNQTAAALIAITTCGANGQQAGAINRVPLLNCDPDFQVWGVGSRTQWNITPSFYVGFDVFYQRIETAFAGSAFFTAAAGSPRPSGNYEISNQENVSATVRAHWDILP
jgi:Porin subfamily